MNESSYKLAKAKPKNTENHTSSSEQQMNHRHRRMWRTFISFRPAAARNTRMKNDEMPKQSVIS